MPLGTRPEPTNDASLITGGAPRRGGRRRVGHISLGAMAGGFVALKGLQAAGLIAAPAWQVLAIAFEAGLVGGLADWYAVTAIFRPAPWPLSWLPLFPQHSNLLVKNRAKITHNLVDLVQNKWITPAALAARLAGMSPSDKLLAWLENPEARGRLSALARQALALVTDRLDSPSLPALLDRAIRRQLAVADLARPLGAWLESALARGDHLPLWDVLLLTLQGGLEDRAVRERLVTALRAAGQRYREERGVVRRLGVDAMELLGVLDYQDIADTLVVKGNEFLAEARRDAEHPLRRRGEALLMGFALRLKAGEAEAVRSVESLRDRVAANADVGRLIATVLANLKEVVGQQLRDDRSMLSGFVEECRDALLVQLREEPGRKESVDRWVRQAIVDLVTGNHDLIGETVRHSLSPEMLSDEELVQQIEDKVGDDLQFIRLNGAVVGFLVGLVLALIEMVARKL